MGMLLTSSVIVLFALTHVACAIEWAKHSEDDMTGGEMAMMGGDHLEYICKGYEEKKLRGNGKTALCVCYVFVSRE
jgi:hypothetical protein